MKQKLIKYVCLIAVVCVAAAGAVAGFIKMSEKKETGFTFAVLSDLHIYAESQVGDPSGEDYKKFDSNGRYLLFSEALLKTAVDNLIAGESEVVLVAGDLTENGSKLSHLAAARELERLVSAGKKVFVVPGNHDVNNYSETFENGFEEPAENVPADEFAKIYARCGYDLALNRDSETLSYTADINDEYRLIAIDVSFYKTNASKGDYTYSSSGRGTACLDERLMLWIEEQLGKCRADGKKPVGLMHFPLLSHLGPLLDNLGFEDTKVNNNIALADLLIDGGMKYIFTGHLHAQDIALYQNEKGSIYDIETGSLASFPSPVRYFRSTAGEEVISSSVLTEIDPQHLPAYISDEMRAAMIADLQAFLSDYYDRAMTTAFMKNIETELMLSILGMLGLNDGDAGVTALAEDLRELVVDFLNMKIYNKDAESDEETLEGIASLYGVTLPESGYKNILGFIYSRLKANSCGDEYAPAGSAENTIFKYGVFSVFYLLHSNDIFGRLNSLDPSIANINLGDTVSTLFTTGGLEVVKNDLVRGIVSSLDFIKDSQLSFLTGLNSAGAVMIIDTILGEMSEFEVGSFRLALSAPVGDYLDIDYDENENITGARIMLGKIIDNELFGKLTEGLINDHGPADNRLIVKK